MPLTVPELISVIGAFAACLSAAAGFVAALHAWRTAQSVTLVKVQLNGRLSELIAAREELAATRAALAASRP